MQLHKGRRPNSTEGESQYGKITKDTKNRRKTQILKQEEMEVAEGKRFTGAGME
jgi:hypothetical protein